MTQADAMKRAAAEAAAALIEDGMAIGLGTGSTADFFVKRLGDRIRDEGLKIRGVPTSIRTMELAKHVGIPLTTLDDEEHLDMTVDGADEVAPNLDLIKGLGGALLREKVVARATKHLIIVADETKLVQKLGTRSPLPVEVLPFATAPVRRAIAGWGHRAELRTREGRPFITDNGNQVLDLHFDGGIADPATLERDLNNIPGVVENGLFLGMTKQVIIGNADGTTRSV